MIYVGGQVDKDIKGKCLNLYDQPLQTRTVMKHINTVLDGFGSDYRDIVKLVAFYVNDGKTDERAFLAEVAGMLPKECHPAITPVPLPWLAYPGMMVEIEPVAMRTPDGKPRLEGIWQAETSAASDLEDHVASFNILAGRSVVVGGQIPYQPWAAKRKAENQANCIDRDPELKCFQPGIPRAMYMPFPFEIVQSSTKVEMVFEFANAQRTIHLNKMEEYPNVGWMGYSTGHWEGDTLVTDVTAFNDATWFDRSGNFHSEDLHVKERFTPRGPDVLMYEATIEDPQVFTKPWKIRMPLYRRLEADARLSDFRCVEMVEETLYGHLRREQLVKHWEGKTMNIDITRKIPDGEEVHERYISGNKPDQE